MRLFLIVLTLLAALAGSSWAVDATAPNFPDLTGRVVDDGHLLSATAQEQLTQRLAEFEAKTSDQVVVVTLPSLNGMDIADYGYQLGRHWGIGQKGRDNGLLLIVAVAEHKVRIEVGYGLEGVMTDAASNAIIRGVILPAFRQGAMEQGVLAGTQAIMGVLTGDENAVPLPAKTQATGVWPALPVIIMILLFFVFAVNHPFLAALFGSSLFRSGSSGFGGGWGGGGGFGGGGEFSGGGGGFGGGGSSGSW